MYIQYGTDPCEKQTGEEESAFWVEQLERYLAPYSQRLDAYLDRRVVGNLIATVAGIVRTRTQLTTSELGSAICGPEHAEAGTQRLQRALHHEGWEANLMPFLDNIPFTNAGKGEQSSAKLRLAEAVFAAFWARWPCDSEQ